MRTRGDIIEILKRNKPHLFEKYPIAQIALFGSYSRNTQNENSDVDILVEFNGRIGSAFIDLANEIERILGVKTDLVSRKAMKPKYFNAIESELIYV
jgi:uncharacterized protein